MTDATVATINLGPLSLPLVSKSFRSLFPHCEYEKHISENYSPPGFFILCGSRASKGVLKLAFLTHLNDRVKVVTIDRSRILDNVQKFRQEISLALQIDDDSLRDKTGESLKKPVPFGSRPRWQIYSSDGTRRYHNIDLLISMSTENPTGTSLLYTGGIFFWPGVKVGHERFVSGIQGFADSGNKRLRLKTLSLRPLIFEIHDFITMQECDHLISKARKHLGDSVVSKMDGDEGKSDTTWRTSKTYFMPRGHTDTLKMLERRVRDITRIPLSHAESAQILRYQKTGHYYTHHDYFDPNSYRNSRSTLDLVENGARNRLSTVFWYMSDVKSGGETNFPRFNGAPPPRDTKSCNAGLNVKPKKGKVIIFHNMLPDGSLDPLSLHAGCSVTEGEKWSANKWIWNKPYSTNGWIGDGNDLAKEASVDLYTTNNSVHTHTHRHRMLGASSIFSGTISSDGDMAMFGETTLFKRYYMLLVCFAIGVLFCFHTMRCDKKITKRRKDKI